MTFSLELPSVLEPLRASLEQLAAPCILLVPAGSARTRTYTGGAPSLRAGSRWPEGPDGPLAFIGQVDFGEAVSAGGVDLGLPDRGLLALFYDRDNFWSDDDAEPRSRFRLVHTEDADAAVELAPPGDLELGERASLLPKRGISLPGFNDRSLGGDDGLVDGKIGDAYIDFLISFIEGQRASVTCDDHRLRGHAAWIAEDGRDVAERQSGAPGWSPLWQLETTGFDDWTEVGMLHVLIRDEDLAARELQNAWVVHQTA